MANAGDTIRNPLSGERITFLQTTGDTNGELLRFEYLIPPGFSIPEHVHPRQEERHEIVSGTLTGRVGGREGTFVEGQRVIGPAGIPHAWRNPSDAEGLIIVSELRPALGFEGLIETAFAIAGDLEADKMGAPKHLLRLSVLLDGSRDDFYPTQIPMPAWRAVLALNAALARAGRSLGYDDGRPGTGEVRGRDGGRLADGRGARTGLLVAGTAAALVFAWRRGRGRWGVLRG
ncbi:MAG TPA: cupin domain-containing protein [Rubrobacter sp.]|nr:cupin domain-containing protein [Rubrobacter sp.]